MEITLSSVMTQLQQITLELSKGTNATYDAEVRLADAEHAYERELNLSLLNNQVGTVADRTAVAKLQASELRLKADLARAEWNRCKSKMKTLELAQMSAQTAARLLETELKALR